MSTYDLNELTGLWAKGNLTTEQAVGQVLLHLEVLSTRIGTVEKQMERLRKKVNVIGKDKET